MSEDNNTNTSDEKTYDLNGDGVPDEATRIGDTTYLDWDRDGKFDAMVTPEGEIYADLDGSYRFRTKVVDSDGDGTIDTLETDLDGDGIPDVIERDTTGDGILDTVERPADTTDLQVHRGTRHGSARLRHLRSVILPGPGRAGQQRRIGFALGGPNGLPVRLGVEPNHAHRVPPHRHGPVDHARQAVLPSVVFDDRPGTVSTSHRAQRLVPGVLFTDPHGPVDATGGPPHVHVQPHQVAHRQRGDRVPELVEQRDEVAAAGAFQQRHLPGAFPYRAGAQVGALSPPLPRVRHRRHAHSPHGVHHARSTGFDTGRRYAAGAGRDTAAVAPLTPERRVCPI